MTIGLKDPQGVIVALKGGLGNQLFQYAIGRSISVRLGVPLTLDLAWFEEVKAAGGVVTTIRKYALEPYGLAVSTSCETRQAGKFERVAAKLSTIVGRYIPAHLLVAGVYHERSFSFDAKVFSLSAPIGLDGYWQSHRYFDEIADLLRLDIGVPQNVSAASLEFADLIKSTDAIAVHIRRGDYVSNQNASATHGICSAEYYQEGLVQVARGLNNPHCFIFSDEPDWVKNNLNFAMPNTVVDINSLDLAHEDLWLMSLCHRFVIANSSLSWWAAWLSISPRKIVVAPRKWFADETKDTSDLIPVDWVLL